MSWGLLGCKGMLVSSLQAAPADTSPASPSPVLLFDPRSRFRRVSRRSCPALAARREDARFLYKRTPDNIKQGSPELQAAFGLLQRMWVKDYQHVWTALQVGLAAAQLRLVPQGSLQRGAARCHLHGVFIPPGILSHPAPPFAPPLPRSLTAPAASPHARSLAGARRRSRWWRR